VPIEMTKQTLFCRLDPSVKHRVYSRVVVDDTEEVRMNDG